MSTRSTLDGWLALLEARHTQPIQLGLERVAAVLERMAVTNTAVVLTVGGTNGKGSTCTMLEAILRAAGYRTGMYSSPHLLRYNERVRVDGAEASDAELVEAFEEVERARGEIALTYFEHGTLAAWAHFCRAQLDVVILEVGLGGRLDAVNVVEPDCAIVTGVAMDHQDYLGDTREAIGFEKAGIFRPGRPAIVGDPEPPGSLLDHALGIGAELWVSGRDFGVSGDRQQWTYWRSTNRGSQTRVRRSGLAYPALRGANQLLNAASVMTALECLRTRLPVSMQAVREGFMLADLPGRFQVLPGRPSVVLDVAHNVQAAGVLAENLFGMGFFPETHAVFAMYADKDVEGVVALMRERIDHWHVAPLSGPRGLSAAALAERMRAGGVIAPIDCHDSVAEAYRAARKCVGENDRIAAFGSFMTVSGVMEIIPSPGADASRAR